jgi:hypothetical protein
MPWQRHDVCTRDSLGWSAGHVPQTYWNSQNKHVGETEESGNSVLPRGISTGDIAAPQIHHVNKVRQIYHNSNKESKHIHKNKGNLGSVQLQVVKWTAGHIESQEEQRNHKT